MVSEASLGVGITMLLASTALGLTFKDRMFTFHNIQLVIIQELFLTPDRCVMSMCKMKRHRSIRKSLPLCSDPCSLCDLKCRELLFGNSHFKTWRLVPLSYCMGYT